MEATCSHPVADVVVFSNDFASQRERPRRRTRSRGELAIGLPVLPSGCMRCLQTL
jgi:hypothetical protein